MPSLKNIETEAPPEQPARAVFDTGFYILALSALAAGVLVVVLKGWDRALEIAQDEMMFMAVLAPKIAAGMFIAATLPLLLPRDKVAIWIGRESGMRGLLLAAFAGAAIPGGPAMTFPLAASFGVVGADVGAIMAFVSSWALLSLNRTLIWEFSFLPVDLVWWRVLLCLPFPILIGLAARAVFGGRDA